MEFHVNVPGGSPDLAAIERQLLEIDPSALVDLDGAPPRLRISTMSAAGDVARALSAAGLAVAAREVELQPSVCCGGCSG